MIQVNTVWKVESNPHNITYRTRACWTCTSFWFCPTPSAPVHALHPSYYNFLFLEYSSATIWYPNESVRKQVDSKSRRRNRIKSNAPSNHADFRPLPWSIITLVYIKSRNSISGSSDTQKSGSEGFLVSLLHSVLNSWVPSLSVSKKYWFHICWND